MNILLSDIAKFVDGNLIGDGLINILGLSSAYDIEADSLVFVDNIDLLKDVESSKAAAIIVSHNIVESSKPIIQVPNPLHAFIRLMQKYYPKPDIASSIHPTAIIATSAKVASDVSIGPFVSIGANSVIDPGVILKSHIHIGNNVHIGARSEIHANVSIYDDVSIGCDVIVHAGTVIGCDGFGYIQDAKGKHCKIPHIGKVVIGNDVEIGANTVIDRATIGKTSIGDGTKIDNLVQVAHSVQLGKNNLLCAFTGIAGSTISGDNVWFAANVGVSDHVKIDDGVILGARTGVPPHKHLKAGNIYLGNPARPKDKAIEHELSSTRIPFIRKQIKELREKIEVLEKKD